MEFVIEVYNTETNKTVKCLRFATVERMIDFKKRYKAEHPEVSFAYYVEYCEADILRLFK